jgi:replication-associated recombination protein RarA
MQATNLFLTQTYLDLNKIQRQLALSFFENRNFDLSKVFGSVEVDQFWESHISQNQIISFDGSVGDTDNKKENFRRFVTQEVYVKYNKPTILFLGDLTTYSDSLQEGMLKLLEEPPANLFIVLFAQNLSQIKPTIISRCRIMLLENSIVFANLDPKLLEKVQKLPAPKTIVEALINNKKVEIEKVADYEREELDFWMWQVQTNLSMLYAQQPQTQIASAIMRTLQARQLNSQNLQKKFAVAQLSL